ncbi:molecular chaperone (ABC1) [Purpureocillium lavendulum]|uniref:Molecular chaperone (ABC1) n=1 Tax=Purpureocillium lavendulum TaxID=1247861 RepID=A0AB34FGX5_9HYPO|nr:molecular chaperone (ABC1) [Purpureocillium lavendulum]
MASTPDQPQALVRKRTDTDLMPPPPQVKKIKRPRQVLAEDEYTDTLAHIIARDYFPGIEVTALQTDYLNALESRNPIQIATTGRTLQDAMTPGRRKPRARPGAFQDGGRTPSTYVGDTPASVASTAVPDKPSLGSDMSLTKFQSTYTSEDNESFYKLVDKQNQKKADKNAWMWNDNKMPSKQMIKQKEVTDKLAESGKLIDDGFIKRDRLAIKDSDDRPARPDSWNANPRNGLMFTPSELDDGVVTVAQRAEEASRMAPKTIVLENTRIPQPHVPQRPPSPTMSSVRDAVAGKPRQRDQDSSMAGGGETPRVNGYTFVDADDEADSASAPLLIDLGPGDAHNPFKVQQPRKRESLHEQMVERIAKSNKEASTKGFTGKAAKTPVPKFPSSPRVSGNLTPAAQRLWSTMGTPKNKTPGSSFGRSTPMRPRGSLLKGVTTPNAKRK